MTKRQLTFAGIAVFGALLLFACSSPKSETEETQGASAACTEPENPYTEGTGHYAGYEWAEQKGGGSCDGSSTSFNEGCEEYEQQEDQYQECERKKN